MRSMNLLWVTIFLCINTIAQVKFDRNGIQTTMSSEDSAKAITQDTLKNLTITHLIGDYFIFTTYKLIQGSVFPSNGMYVLTDIGVVLFDTPWDTSQFQPLLDSIEFRHHKKVISSISTHFHDDRTAAVNYYNDKGIKTHSSKLICVKRKVKISRPSILIRIQRLILANTFFKRFIPARDIRRTIL